MIIELTNEERAILRVSLGYLLGLESTPTITAYIKALRERLTRDGE